MIETSDWPSHKTPLEYARTTLELGGWAGMGPVCLGRHPGAPEGCSARANLPHSL